MTTKFRQSREAMLNRHERRTWLFVAACGALIIGCFLIGWLA